MLATPQLHRSSHISPTELLDILLKPTILTGSATNSSKPTEIHPQILRKSHIPSEDFIRVPPQPAFFEQINYYRTCFHELGHWTGHKDRLARDLSHGFGSKPYAREELVAEMASAFVCASLSIAPTVRHTDYIGSWLEVLKEDNRAIFRAASQASKAADFILAFQYAETSPEAVA